MTCLVSTDLLYGHMCGVVDCQLRVAIVTVGEGHPLRLLLLEMGMVFSTALRGRGEGEGGRKEGREHGREEG